MEIKEAIRDDKKVDLETSIEMIDERLIYMDYLKDNIKELEDALRELKSAKNNRNLSPLVDLM